MKSRTTIKTRFLALALTVLMIVGVLPFSVFAIGVNDAGNKLETDNAIFKAPTGQDVIDVLGENALIYYNNFNDGTPNGSALGNASFTRSNGWTWVDDGNGGKAPVTKDGQQQDTMITIGKNHGAQVATYAGKSFVFSGDFKLGEVTQAGGLFYFISAVNGTENHNFTLMPVWIDAAGNLYNGQVTSTFTGAVSKKSINSGTMWESNDVGAQSTIFCTADKKIGALSADEFTNIAVSVNPAANVYSIYIDGVCVAANQTLACQTMLDYYAACDAENGTVDFPNGYYSISGICLGYRNKIEGGISYIFDNWLAYLADKPLGANGLKYDSSISADDLTVNSSIIKNAYKDDASYWQKFNTNVTDNRGGTKNNGNGSWTVPKSGNAQYLVTYSTSAAPNTKAFWDAGLAGLDIKTSFELTLDSSSTAGGLGKIAVWMPVGTNGGAGHPIIMITPIDRGGSKVFELAWPNAAGNAAATKFAEIPGNTKVSVDIIFDLSLNNDMYYVFINGNYVGGNSIFNGKTSHWDKITYQQNLINGFRAAEPDKEVGDGLIFDGLRFYSNKAVGMVIGNLNMYHYDDNADGNVTDSARKVNISAPVLKHYQDFNAIAEGAMSAKPNSLLGGGVQADYKSGVAVVDDGRGGKALSTTAAGNIYYEVYPNAASGTNFVTSMDIKLTKAPTEVVCLFNGCAYNARVDLNGDGVEAENNGERDFDLGMLYLDKNGDVWVARKTDATSSGVLVNYSADTSSYLAIKVATLNTVDYTNLAVAVNAAQNTFKVYVNGVAVTEDLQLLTDSDLALLSNPNFAGQTPYANGFGLTHRRFAVRPFYLLDNVAVYYADDILYNKINKTPLNGYVKNDNKYYYYKDACILPGFNSADGLLSSGADGVIMYNGTAVTNMRTIYKYVGNDIVPVNGKFSGVYTYTKSGACYVYGTDKILVKNKVIDTVYSGITSELNEPTGFNINAVGVATPLNGMHTVEGGKTYFYVNGVRTTGFINTANGVFLINSDYTFFAGQKTVEGKTYMFDATTGKGSLLNGVYVDVEHADTPDRIYIDGEYQIGLVELGGVKYFADIGGVLKTGIQTDPESGNNYYFYEGGANKYEMAVGVSVVYNGGVITIGPDGIIDPETDKEFGGWSQVNGTWYYSDASGNLKKGLAYIEVGYDGNEGGYYYFDNNGVMLKDAYTSVYGTEMYFGANGVAPTGVVTVGSDYKYFVNGVAPVGKTEVIQDGYIYTFDNGNFVSRKELDANNPEVRVEISKNGNTDSFFFNTVDGAFSIVLTNYPCYTFKVYDVTDPDAVVEVQPAQGGSYTLEKEKSYKVIYEKVEHVYGTEPIKVEAPTCGKAGYKVFACTVDGCVATHREVIAATGEHTYPDAHTQIIERPTCVQMGLGIAWCTECGNAAKDYDIAINPDAHDYGAWDIKYEATCVKDGLKSRECDLCGKYDREIIESTGEHVKGALTTVAPTCTTEGTNTWACTNPECDYKFVETIPVDYSNHTHGNVNGTIERFDDKAYETDGVTVKYNVADYFELFQITKASTCYENGHATYRCKDCGGFVYGVTTDLDPSNHHYNPGEGYSNNGSEYLAVLDVNGDIIEKVEIVNGEVLVNGVKVADADGDATNDREEMLSYSNMVCGYAEYAEWRIDCQNPACVGVYKVTGEVEGSFMHQFDLSVKYSTTDKNDPFIGYHYYICNQCGKAGGLAAHNYAYAPNGDGTHTATCTDGCKLDATTDYSEVFGCEYEIKYNDTEHWLECKLCGHIKDSVAHTLVDSDDGINHLRDCACGYQEMHHMSAICHKEATCCEAGYTDYMDCDICDYTAGKEIIPIIAHNITNVLVKDDTGHWYACSNTCNGVQCEFKYRFAEHNYVDADGLEPTCTEPGYTAYKVCTVCEHELGRNPLLAKNHDVTGAPYSHNNDQHWQLCNNCGEFIYESHDNYLVDLNDIENGIKKCSVCNYDKHFHENTWWYALGLDRIEVNGHYYYTYGSTIDAIVEIGGSFYYFDDNGYLVMTGDNNVGNANLKADNGIFDTIGTIDNHGVITDAILDTANGIYYIVGGQYQSGWQEIAGKFYFFNTKLNNVLVAEAPEFALVKGGATIIALDIHGTAKILVNVDANGARLLGVVDNGDGTASYYLDGTAGKLVGRIEDNYYNVGKIYFAKTDGTLYSGIWTSVDGIYYSFDADYALTEWHKNQTATIEIEGVPTIIYTDGEGRRIITGWYETEGVGGRYIKNGDMVTNMPCYEIAGTYYVIDVDGYADYYSGWLDDTHYIASGMLVKSRFQEINGNKYYFDGEGDVVKASAGTTIKVVIGTWVWEIDENGYAEQYVGTPDWVWFIDAETGKVSTTDKGYYKTETGLIKDEAITIGVSTYVFDANGVLVRSKSNYTCNDVVYVIDAEGKATKLEDNE